MDGPTWEQSDKLVMRFNDEEKTECIFVLHCEEKDCGATYMYTGEDGTCENDEMPNIYDGNLCSDEECPDCTPIRDADEASVDENDLVRCTHFPPPLFLLLRAFIRGYPGGKACDTPPSRPLILVHPFARGARFARNTAETWPGRACVVQRFSGR